MLFHPIVVRYLARHKTSRGYKILRILGKHGDIVRYKTYRVSPEMGHPEIPKPHADDALCRFRRRLLATVINTHAQTHTYTKHAK